MNGHTVCLDNEFISIKVFNHICVSFVRVKSEINHHFLKENFNFRAATNYYFFTNLPIIISQLIICEK